jgi:peptide/nickel transport system substrate-binding protein
VRNKNGLSVIFSPGIVLLILLIFVTACSAPVEETPLVNPTEAPAAEAEPTESAADPTEAPAAEVEPTQPAAEPTEPTAETEEEAVAPSGTLVVGIPHTVNALDKANGATEYANSISQHIQQMPLYPHPDGSVGPLLAESWEIIDDTHVRFNLRQGVTFTNGEPFNADVFMFSWEWINSNDVANAETWANVEAIDIHDDYSLTITFTNPDPLQLQKMAYFYPLYPPEYTQEVGMEGFGQAPIGTGPFVLDEWVAGDRIVLKANPDYYEPGRPRLETVIFRPVTEDATRAAALQAGDIDIARLVPDELVLQLEQDPNIEVLKIQGTRNYSVLFNNMTTGVGTPIESREVRQALNYAVDNEQIVDVILEGNGVAVDSFITPIMFGYDESQPTIPYDPERARELLAEAGYPDGFSIAMACPAGAYVKIEQVCQAVAGYLEDVGVIVDLQIIESGQFWDQEASREIAPLFLDGWGARFPDATTPLLGAFVPDTVVDYGSTWANYYDPRYVELYEAQGFTLDQEKRQEAIQEFHRYMVEEPAAIWLYQSFVFTGVRNRVQGLEVYANETQLLYDVSVTDE